MTTPQEKILEIEHEMSRTQKNKATSGHLGLLKAKVAKLKREIILGKARASGGGPGEGFDVTKSGDARVGMIGFPSVGKSTLLNTMTETKSEAANYEFTTLTCIPGNLLYKGTKIQLLDLPGIIEGAKDGKGRGRQVIGVARTCDLILLVLDVSKPLTHKSIIENELEGFGIRVNKDPPRIGVRKTKGGGIHLIKAVKQTHLEDQTIINICREYRYVSVELTLRQDCTAEDIIDVLDGRVVYIPCIFVLNMIDKISIEELDILARMPHVVPISAKASWNLDMLKEEIWEHLALTRVYTKPRGQLPDYSEPVILRRDARTVANFCQRIHRTLLDNFKYAWVWGNSVKHQPQKVGKEHMLSDEDIVQIVTRV